MHLPNFVFRGTDLDLQITFLISEPVIDVTVCNISKLWCSYLAIQDVAETERKLGNNI